MLKGCEGAMVHGCVVLDRALVHTSCIGSCGSGSGRELELELDGCVCCTFCLILYRTHRSEQSRGFFI